MTLDSKCQETSTSYLCEVIMMFTTKGQLKTTSFSSLTNKVAYIQSCVHSTPKSP